MKSISIKLFYYRFTCSCILQIFRKLGFILSPVSGTQVGKNIETWINFFSVQRLLSPVNDRIAVSRASLNNGALQTGVGLDLPCHTDPCLTLKSEGLCLHDDRRNKKEIGDPTVRQYVLTIRCLNLRMW